MSSHYPECRVRTYTTDDGMVYEVAGDLCICDRLRACEERIKQSIAALSWYSKARWTGYYEGIDAAREAVETAWTDDPSWDGTNWNNALHEALVAIDALRGDR